MQYSHKQLKEIAKNRKKALRNKIIIGTTVVYPLTTLGQVIEIFKNQSASNVSLPTYSLYLFFTLILLWYGVAEKLKPIIVLQSLWFVMYGLVFIGLLLYR